MQTTVRRKKQPYYKTIGRQQHRHGRLSLYFAFNPSTRFLTAAVVSARGLNIGHDSGRVRMQVRLQLLPHADPALVEMSLFKTNVRKDSHFKKRTESHIAAPNPVFDEEFQFDLNPLWKFQTDFRLYAAVVALDPTLSSGIGLLGMTSFALPQLLTSDPSAALWYWLFPQKSGMNTHEFVEQAIIEEEALTSVQIIELTGRGHDRANAQINGIYLEQDDTYCGRPSFKHRDDTLFLYFHQGRGAWAVAEAIGSTAPLGFVDDKAPTPDQIRGNWMIYNRDRQFVANARRHQQDTGRAREDAHGRFEIDANVRCFLTNKPEATALSSMTTVSQRLWAIQDFLLHQQRFMTQLSLVQSYNRSLRSLSSDEGKTLFRNIDELAAVSAYFTDRIAQHSSKDPNFNEPIGEILCNVVPGLRKPFLTYCQGVRSVGEVLQAMAASKPAFQTELETLKLQLPASSDLAVALLAPLLQVQRYPSFIAQIQRGSREINSPSVIFDVQLLGAAMEEFTRLAGETARIAGDAMRATKFGVFAKKESPLDHIPDVLPAGLVSAIQERQKPQEHQQQRTQEHPTHSNPAVVVAEPAFRGSHSSSVRVHIPPPPMEAVEMRQHAVTTNGVKTNTRPQGSVIEDDDLDQSKMSATLHHKHAADEQQQEPEKDTLSHHATKYKPEEHLDDQEAYSPLRSAVAPTDQEVDAGPHHVNYASGTAAAPLSISTPVQSDVPEDMSLCREQHESLALRSRTRTKSISLRPVKLGAPVWFHGEASKKSAGGLLTGQPDGTFIVRMRPKEKDTALALVFEGQTTHHLLSQREDDGVVLINGVNFGSPRSLRELVDKLRVPQERWPQPLISFIARPEATDVEIEMEEQRAKAAVSAHAEANSADELAYTNLPLPTQAKQEPNRTMSIGSAGQLDAARHWFSSMTTPTVRHLEAEDLVLVAYRLGLMTSLTAVHTFMDSVELAPTDHVDFMAFKTWFAQHPMAQVWNHFDQAQIEEAQMMMTAFEKTDVRKQGSLNLKDFEQVCQVVGRMVQCDMPPMTEAWDLLSEGDNVVMLGTYFHWVKDLVSSVA